MAIVAEYAVCDRQRDEESRPHCLPPALAGIGLVVLLASSCAMQPAGHGDGRTGAPNGALPALSRADSLWLERVGFGLDSASVAAYRRLGRERYLERELDPGAATLPAAIGADIAALEVARVDSMQVLAAVDAERKAANALPEGPEREAARKALNDRGDALANQAMQRDLLRAVYSSGQLREQMVWFWLNHFSVYQHKAQLRWLVADYEEQAIRPHVFGHFRDLVLATLEHPAMLQYLDNDRNTAGHVNENYARELLELHTLGVGSGYTQADVQQLARILTGVGINASGNAPTLKPELQRLYVRRGALEFNPAKHDFGPKVLLGHRIDERGLAEVEAAVDVIVRQPACARFVARELATYFVADDPPPALVERMTQTFRKTDGDIAAVLRTMFLSQDLGPALGAKFKDPMRFVVSAVRFAYDGRAITNTRPMIHWLNGLGELPYGRQTPDGYPLTEQNWASSGQMSRRFEIARAIGSGSAGLFDADAPSTPGVRTGFPQLSNRLYFETVEPYLAARTRDALNRATSPQEWNTFLLCSPEFNDE